MSTFYSWRMADTPRARALAKELREARAATGMALAEVAEALGWSEAKVSRMETAKRSVKPADLEALLNVLEVRGEDRRHLLKMAHQAQTPNWWELGRELSQLQSAFVDSEQRAERITHVSLTLVPGLLQTRPYTREVMETAGVDEGRVEEKVAFRQMRQGVLTKRKPVALHTFMDEAVFWRGVGGPRIMAEQLRHIASIGEAENVALRVLPRGAGAHAGLSGGFVLFEFSRSRPIVFLESATSGALVDRPDDVALFQETAALVEKQASSPEASRGILDSYVQQYESETT